MQFTRPDYCSYCGAGHAKCMVYIIDAEKKLYKCDACLHLGASVLPGESGYQGSWGHQVSLLKKEKVEKPAKSVESKRSALSLAEEVTVVKRPRVDSYTITWNDIQQLG